MRQDIWEEKCVRCARCCYEKIEFEGRIYYTDTPCEKLDLQSGLCKVYKNRVVERPGCVALTSDLVKRGILPGDCPYVQGIENYVAPCVDDPGIA